MRSDFLSICLCTGGNGKQIFGDAWWLEPEEDARLAAEPAGGHVPAMDQSAAFAAATKASLGKPGPVLSPFMSFASQ